MRIKNPRIRSCAILQRFRWLCFFSCQIFLFNLEKNKFVFFSRLNKKKFATKKLKLPSESLDNFASCHAAVFKILVGG